MKKKTDYNREDENMEKNLMGGRKKSCKKEGGGKEEQDWKEEEKWKEMRRSKRKRDE